MTTPRPPAELAEIAGKAAHDFKNLLAIILGNAELLEEGADGEDFAEMLKLIHEAAERGNQLADELAAAVAANMQDAGSPSAGDG